MGKKIYMMFDIEGATGFTNADECAYGDPAWQRMRKIATDDVNAAIAGAFDGGATEVLVNDAHGFMRNLMIEYLDPRACLISGRIKTMSMMQGLDESYDGVMMVGAHAKAGSLGIMSHTMFGTMIDKIVVNGKEVGEMGLNALVADQLCVPVIMACGDQATHREAVETFGEIEFAETKEDITRFCAKLYPPKVSQERIRQASERAVRNLDQYHPGTLPERTVIEITFHGSNEADYACMIPYIERVDDRTVSLSCANARDAYQLAHAAMTLANVTTDVKYG